MPLSAPRRVEQPGDPVVDRVQKLLRLAQNPNPHEGARAREKAQELIDRYHLTPDGRARRFEKFGVRWRYNVVDRRVSEEPAQSICPRRADLVALSSADSRRDFCKPRRTYRLKGRTTMFLKRDPGRCPVDDSPHHTCVAPGSSGGAIVAGPITPATEVIVPSASTPAAAPPATTAPPADATFTNRNYRGRNKREPPPSTAGA